MHSDRLDSSPHSKSPPATEPQLQSAPLRRKSSPLRRTSTGSYSQFDYLRERGAALVELAIVVGVLVPVLIVIVAFLISSSRKADLDTQAEAALRNCLASPINLYSTGANPQLLPVGQLNTIVQNFLNNCSNQGGGLPMCGFVYTNNGTNQYVAVGTGGATCPALISWACTSPLSRNQLVVMVMGINPPPCGFTGGNDPSGPDPGDPFYPYTDPTPICN